MDVMPATYRVDEIRYPARVAATEKELASRLTTSNRDQYVALVDLLGFSALVARDWTRAVTVYSAIMAVAEHTYAALANVATVDTILAYPVATDDEERGTQFSVATVTAGKRRVRLLLAGLPFGFRSASHERRVLDAWGAMLRDAA
jgi:hypothetical protein